MLFRDFILLFLKNMKNQLDVLKKNVIKNLKLVVNSKELEKLENSLL
jgi:hypothetical protein